LALLDDICNFSNEVNVSDIKLEASCCEGGDHVSVTVAENGPIVQPPDDTRVNMELRWNDIVRGRSKTSGEKPGPVPLCPPQIPHGLSGREAGSPR
jgi:hypothetical protein